MKKFLVSLLVSALLLTLPAFAADVDLSGMTFDELVALKDQINLAIWNSQEWQEVTVPIGVWEIGKDIPEGHWTMKVEPGSAMEWGSIQYGGKLDDLGKKIEYVYGEPYYTEMIQEEGTEGVTELTEIDLDMASGMFLVIEYTDMVFTPYAGKPSLGFK